MDIHEEIQQALADLGWRPRGIRFSVESFKWLFEKGHISPGSGGPLGLVEWVTNVPWYDGNIFAWCDPSFDGVFELPACAPNKPCKSGDA